MASAGGTSGGTVPPGSGAGGAGAAAGGASGEGGEAGCPGDTESGCPPLVDAGANRTVPCSSPEGATFELSGSAFDRDGIQSVAWTRNGETIGMSLTLEVTAPLGQSEFVLTATDITGDVASDSVVVAVMDSEPPALAAPNIEIVLCQCESFTPPAPTMIDCRPEAATATNPLAIGSTRNGPRFDEPEQFPLEHCPGESLLVLWTLSDGDNTTEIDQLVNTRIPFTQAEQEACD